MPEAYPGFKARLYVVDQAALVHVTAEECNVTNAKGEIDVSRRGFGFRQKIGGLKDFDVNGSLIKDHTDAGQTLLKDAYVNDTILDVVVLDQDQSVTGAEGWRAQMTVRDWNESQPLEEGVKIAFHLMNDPADDPIPVTAPVTVAATVEGQNDPPEDLVEVPAGEAGEPEPEPAEPAS